MATTRVVCPSLRQAVPRLGLLAAALAVSLLAALLPLAHPAAAFSSTGALFSFGDPDAGRLGRVTGAAGRVGIAARASQVDGGDGHGIAVLDTGQVAVWGRNDAGQLGSGTTSTEPGAPTVLAGIGSVVSVAAGDQHTLVVDAAGTVYSFGANDQSQLGRNTTVLIGGDPAVPTAITFPGLQAGEQIEAVAAGTRHSLALTDQGRVYAWGDNRAGQAGAGLTEVDPIEGGIPANPLSVGQPRVVGGLGGIVAIGAAGDSSLAVSSGGAVYGFGDNGDGQLGDRETGLGTSASTPEPITVAEQPITDVVQAVATATSTIIRRTDGSVAEIAGQPTALTEKPFPGPVTDVAAGSDHVLALVDRSDGAPTGSLVEVWGFGSNGAGQLGVAGGPSPTMTSIPTNDLRTAVTVGAGTRASFVASAPTVSTDAILVDFEDEFGPVELDDKTDAIVVRIDNEGPGSATVSPVAQLPGSDFAVTADTCGSVPEGGNCDVSVVFTARALGLREGLLVIDHDGFSAPLEVSLQGRGTTIEGQISITADTESVINETLASPSAIPLDEIAVQPGAPRHDAEGAPTRIPLGDLDVVGTRIPLGDLDVVPNRIPLGDLDVVGTRIPLGDLDVVGPRIPLGDLDVVPNRIPLGDLDVVGPKMLIVLESTALSDLPITEPYRWDDQQFDASVPAYDGTGHAILSGSTALHGQPLHTVSLADVLRDVDAAERFANLPLAAIDFTRSPFGGVGLDAFLIGNVTLAELGEARYGWCEQLETAGYADCGRSLGRDGASDALSATPIELELAGLPIDALNFAAVQLGDLGADHGVATELFLDQMPLYQSDFGSVGLDDVDDVSLVADCSDGFECQGATVHDAFQADRLLPAAQVGDLATAVDEMTIARLIFGFLPIASLPFGAASLDDLLVKYYGDPTDRPITYTVTYTADATVPTSARLQVRLPDSFAYIPRSAVVQGPGGEAVDVLARADADDDRILQWPIPMRVEAGETVQLTFAVRPGLKLGVFTIEPGDVAVVGASGSISNLAVAAPVRVLDADTAGDGNDTVETADPITPSIVRTDGSIGTMHLGHLSSAEDVDIFQFDAAAVPDGSDILVQLEHQTGGDADVVLYGTSDMTGIPPMRPAERRQPLTLTEDVRPLLDESTGSLASDAILDERAIIEGLPVLGISQERETYDERILAKAPAGGTGQYTIAVVPYNGATDSGAYSLRVTILPPADIPTATARPAQSTPVPAPGSGPVVDGIPATANTVFVTAPGRMADDPTVDLFARLADSRLSAIIGSHTVLAVDRVAAVATAYDAWDAQPGDPEAANDVVRAINTYVDGITGPDLGYVVIVGGDDVIPMGRIPDLTSTVSERPFTADLLRYTDPAAPGNSILGVPAANMLLSDDVYADLAPTPIHGFQYLYLPDLAIGRLTETEREIDTLLDRFMDAEGLLDGSTALTTSSADFLDDLASGLGARLSERLDTEVIVDDAAWDGDSGDGEATLRDAIAAADVLAVNGHSDPFQTDTAGSIPGSLRSDEFANIPFRPSAVLLAAGCHMGTPLTDSVLRAGLPPEFSQGLAVAGVRSQALNTGYGVGSRSTLGYTEQLLLRYAEQLGGYDQGQAIRAAKKAYVADQGYIDEIDLKILHEFTHFGMPHLRYRGSTDPTAPTPVTEATGPSVVTVDLDIDTRRVETPDGSYFVGVDASGRDRFLSAPGQPIVPATTLVVGPETTEVTGLIIEALATEEKAGIAGSYFDPVLDVPVLTGGTLAPRNEPNYGDVNFPANLWSSQGNVVQLATGLFRSVGLDGDGNTTGSMTVATSARARIYSTPVGATFGLPRPRILSVRTLVEDTLTFVVTVAQNASLDEVSMLYRGVDGGVPEDVWRFAPLHEIAPGTWTATAALVGDEVETMAQARLGSITTTLRNKARLTPSVAMAPGPFAEFELSVVGDAAPSNVSGATGGWWERADVLITSPSGAPLEASINGGPRMSVTGSGPGLRDLPEGTNVIRVFHRGDLAGEVPVRVDRSAPTIDIVSPRLRFWHLPSYVYRSTDAVADFSCADDHSGTPRCEAIVVQPDGSEVSVTPGGALPTSQPGIHVVWFEAADGAGHTHKRLSAYISKYDFDGFLSPLADLPTATSWKAGRTVPLKWRLRDAAGNAVIGLDVVEAIGAIQYPCSWTSSVPGSDPDQTTGLSHNGDRYRYGIATQSSSKNECFTYVMLLDDDTLHAVAIEFTK